MSIVVETCACRISFCWTPTGVPQESSRERYSLQRGMQLLFQVEQQEIALEQIGEHDNRRLLFWEAAEGGNGIWQRLIEDPNALAKVAEKALDICHFEASTGAELPGWA